MNISGLKKLPTATVSEGRLRIYQPTQRPVRKTVVLEGAWIKGKVKITGRLGQRHADLMEIIRASTIEWGLDNGRVAILVDPYVIRKKLGGSGYYSHERMYSLLQDLREATIEIDTPDFRGIGGLLDQAIEAKRSVRDPLTGTERFLMRIDLGAMGTALLENDLFLYYNPEPISALATGMAQAVARHVLTHRAEPNGGWKLDTLIHAVAGDIKNAPLWKARAAIKADADGLAKCGVVLDGGRVHLASKFIPQRPGVLP